MYIIRHSMFLYWVFSSRIDLEIQGKVLNESYHPFYIFQLPYCTRTCIQRSREREDFNFSSIYLRRIPQSLPNCCVTWHQGRKGHNSVWLKLVYRVYTVRSETNTNALWRSLCRSCLFKEVYIYNITLMTDYNQQSRWVDQ
jgi:hypothetical protein